MLAHRFLFACLLIAIGLIGALVFVRSDSPESAPNVQTRPAEFSHSGTNETVAAGNALIAHSNTTRPNPAAQKAGAPNPEDVKNAAASAERAAKAAAQLANPGN
jgi:hypothetical protein